MTTLVLERAYETAPEHLVELRNTVGELIIEGDPEIIERPDASLAIDQYSSVVGSIWAEAAVSDAATHYGEDVTGIARGALAVRCGKLVQNAVTVEVEELKKVIDSSPSLSRRQRFAKKIRGLFTVPEVTCLEATAFTIFDKHIEEPERGEIAAPQDLEAIVKSSAKEFITNNILDLYQQ